MARVLALERVALDAPELVYNFTVKGLHTYFVLEAGVLVHNDRICGWVSGSGNSNVYRFSDDDDFVSALGRADEDSIKRLFDRINQQRQSRGFPPKTPLTQGEINYRKSLVEYAIASKNDFFLEKWAKEHAGETVLNHIRRIGGREFNNPRLVSGNISATDNILALARSGDSSPGGVQEILYGTGTRDATKYIYEISVPNTVLYRPNLTVSKEEYEVLIIDVWTANKGPRPLSPKWNLGNIGDKLQPIRRFDNPLAGADIRHVQDTLTNLHSKLGDDLYKMSVEHNIGLLQLIKSNKLNEQQLIDWITPRIR